MAFYDELFHDFGDAANQPLVGRHLPPKDQMDHPADLEESQWQEKYIGNLSAIMSREWLEEAESSGEVIRLPTRLRTINCMVIGMDGSFGYDPGLGINIISSFLVQTQLSEEPLSSSQKRLHVTPTQSLDCHGILTAAPIRIANPTLYLNFHILDLSENLSHNIIIGRPIMKILEKVPRDHTTRNYLICDAFFATFSENVTNVHCSPKHCDDFFISSRFYDVFLSFVTDVHRSPKHYDDLLNSSRFYDVFLFSSQTLRRFV
jgi:hypothetical protein